MKIILPGTRTGEIVVPSSKSMAHRLLLCAALSQEKTTLLCNGISKDIYATIECLNALGANITIIDNKIEVNPIRKLPSCEVNLNCYESGTTLRFLFPVVAALGVKATFHMEASLSKRPMYPLLHTLEKHNVFIQREDDAIFVEGKLTAGEYSIPGDISSQFISGLLFALPLVKGNSSIEIEGELESEDYCLMTEDVIRKSGISFQKIGNNYEISGEQKYRMQGVYDVEGDWSNASPFLCMGAVSKKGIVINNLNMDSLQGDKRILSILTSLGANVQVGEQYVKVSKGNWNSVCVDAKNVLDIVPVVATICTASSFITKLEHINRLRYKESDRIESVMQLITSLGGKIEESANALIVCGTNGLLGGNVHTQKDHRIAMAAAVGSCIATKEIVLDDEECVNKSYPSFWKEFESLEVEL